MSKNEGVNESKFSKLGISKTAFFYLVGPAVAYTLSRLFETSNSNSPDTTIGTALSVVTLGFSGLLISQRNPILTVLGAFGPFVAGLIGPENPSTNIITAQAMSYLLSLTGGMFVDLSLSKDNTHE